MILRSKHSTVRDDDYYIDLRGMIPERLPATVNKLMRYEMDDQPDMNMLILRVARPADELDCQGKAMAVEIPRVI